MYRENDQHLQQHLFSDLSSLSAKSRARLDESWGGVFYREFFCRLDETPFAALYSDKASRPNIPVNVLVGLETLKAGFGWSDAEMHDAFTFDLQVRYALGYRNLGDGEFELRTVYNFRRRLTQHMQETGENLLDQAFVRITDSQIESFQLKTGKLRMDSTQIASNIRQMTRLQLLVEVVQRVHRMLSEADQEHYVTVFAPYLRGSSGQYVYHIRGQETAPHMQAIGELMQRLLVELASAYADNPVYQTLQRVFAEQFTVSENSVRAQAGRDISPRSLHSPDDPDATYRRKGNKEYHGYVTNVTETCDTENPFQLIVKVQTAPNSTEDTTMLIEALPELKERTGVETLYNDAGYCGPPVDQVLRQQQVEQVPTNLCGRAPREDRFSLADFQISSTPDGQPIEITCPQGQAVLVETGRTSDHHLAYFAATTCQTCPRQQSCPTRVRKCDQRRTLCFNRRQIDVAQRRRRCAVYRQSGKNPRAAVEATVGAIKRRFSDDQLPVRGHLRMAALMVCSAAMFNVRRIHRHLAHTRALDASRQQAIKRDAKLTASTPSFLTCISALVVGLRRLFRPSEPALSFGC